MKCQRRDCTAEATGALAINVPAVGHEIGTHPPITITVGLCLCDRHIADVSVKEFLEADPKRRLQASVEGMCRAQGKAAPDFDRAFVSKVEFTDPAYLRLTATKN